MEWIGFAIIGLEGLVALAITITLIVLIVRRVRISQEESFEKRDN